MKFMPPSCSTTTIISVYPASNRIPLLDSLRDLPLDPPSLYMKLKSASLILLLVLPLKRIYSIDLDALGEDNLHHDLHETSLKSVLESPKIPKVCFDVRAISRVLYNTSNISLSGVKDLQLMELATRIYSREYLAAFSKCISEELSTNIVPWDDWLKSKYQVVVSDLASPAEKSTVKDMFALVALWEAYSGKLKPAGKAFWRVQVCSETKNRINQSKSLHESDNKQNFSRGPWDLEQAENERDAWNEQVLTAAQEGLVLNANDEWVGDGSEERESWNEKFLMAAQDGMILNANGEWVGDEKKENESWNEQILTATKEGIIVNADDEWISYDEWVSCGDYDL